MMGKKHQRRGGSFLLERMVMIWLLMVLEGIYHLYKRDLREWHADLDSVGWQALWIGNAIIIGCVLGFFGLMLLIGISIA
jgi:hypothetical protein